jgi:hypothetical protein
MWPVFQKVRRLRISAYGQTSQLSQPNLVTGSGGDGLSLQSDNRGRRPDPPDRLFALARSPDHSDVIIRSATEGLLLKSKKGCLGESDAVHLPAARRGVARDMS